MGGEDGPSNPSTSCLGLAESGQPLPTCPPSGLVLCTCVLPPQPAAWCAKPCRFVLACFCVPLFLSASLCFTKGGPVQEEVVEWQCLLAAYSASRAWSAFALGLLPPSLSGMLPGKSEVKVLQLLPGDLSSSLAQGCTLGVRVRGGTHGLAGSVPHYPPQVCNKWWGGTSPSGQTLDSVRVNYWSSPEFV